MDGLMSNIYVSMTTIPNRIDHLHLIMSELSNQTVKPTNILLWLPREYKRANSVITEIPQYLLSYGIDIRWCDNDLGPLTKGYYTNSIVAKNDDDIIVTIDDDVIIWDEWLEGLVDGINKTDGAVGYRGKIVDLSGHKHYNKPIPNNDNSEWLNVDIITATWGLAYRKYMIPSISLDIHKDCPECFFVDDIVINGLLAHNGYKRYIKNTDKIVINEDNCFIEALWDINRVKNHNDICINHFINDFRKNRNESSI